MTQEQTHRSDARRSYWPYSVTGVALVLALPVLVVLGFVLVPAGEVWHHLAETVLADYVRNSLLLMLGVAIGLSLIHI